MEEQRITRRDPMQGSALLSFCGPIRMIEEVVRLCALGHGETALASCPPH